MSSPREKFCPGCGKTKPSRAFGLDSRTATKLKSRCKECHNKDNRASHARNPEQHHRSGILYAYGISLEEYKAFLEKPCGLCGRPATDLDHDHVTGEVRGGLCHSCNLGLGHLGDSPARLRAAANWIEGRVR